MPDPGLCWSRIVRGPGLSRGVRVDFDSGLGSTGESPVSDECADFARLEVPGTNREGVELLHAPKPPDEELRKEDDAGVPKEVWPKVDVDPNAGCPKAGVAFVPKPVCPNPDAGFGVSFCALGEGLSGLG